MGIVALENAEFKVAPFVVSRLVYAVEVKDDGSGQVMVEAMVTTSSETQTLNSLELLVPFGISEVVDRSETFLDERIRENHYRRAYKIVDKQAGTVNLSGSIVKILPISISYDSIGSEFSRILLTFPTPFKANEKRVFRITYDVPSFAQSEKSVLYGWRKLTITMSFYDNPLLDHADTKSHDLVEHVAAIAECERVHVWLAVPHGYDISNSPVPGLQIRRDYDEVFLSPGKKAAKRAILSWEYDSLKAWALHNRIHVSVRKEILGLIDLLGLCGFFLALVTLILALLRLAS